MFENLGLRPSLKTQIFNGKLDCDFRKYQLFSGRLSDFRAEGGKVKTDEERRLMSDQRRFKTQRDEFKKRLNEEENSPFEGDDELDQQYRILRKKHREFEQTRAPRKPKREGGFRKEGFGGKREGGFKSREGGFKKKGGFGGKREGGFKKKGGYNNKG